MGSAWASARRMRTASSMGSSPSAGVPDGAQGRRQHAERGGEQRPDLVGVGPDTAQPVDGHLPEGDGQATLGGGVDVLQRVLRGDRTGDWSGLGHRELQG